jgi:hypothetical protein
LLQRGRTQLEIDKSAESMSEIDTAWMREKAISDPNTPKEIKDNIEHLRLVRQPPSVVISKLQVMLQSAPLLMDMEPHILKNKTDVPFIMSDAPVVFYNRLYADVTLRGVLGIQNPGLMIFFPISPTTQLMLLDHNSYKGEALENRVINITHQHDSIHLNKLQLHHCADAVYFPPTMPEQILKKMWKQERNSFVNLADNVVKAPGYNMTGEDLGEIIHIFERQIPYRLNLSYLDSSVLGDHQYKFSYRSPMLVEHCKAQLR